MKHELKTPIKAADGTIIKTVEVGTVKVKHLKAAEDARADGGDMAAGIALLAANTGLSIESVEEMDMRDFEVLSKQLESFLSKPA